MLALWIEVPNSILEVVMSVFGALCKLAAWQSDFGCETLCRTIPMDESDKIAARSSRKVEGTC